MGVMAASSKVANMAPPANIRELALFSVRRAIVVIVVVLNDPDQSRPCAETTEIVEPVVAQSESSSCALLQREVKRVSSQRAANAT